MVAAGWQRLKDGRTVLLRVAGPRDVPAIERLLTELSPESFYRRFQGGQATPALVARLARFGPAPALTSLVAATQDDPARLAAEARYVPLGHGVAEFGLTVLDSYQGAGLGRILLGALVARASEAGLARLRAVVSLDNAPMLHLVQQYGWVLAEPTDECSVACVEISTVGGMPGWPAAMAGRRALVEHRGWFESAQAARLRAAGYEVRQCTGPSQHTSRTCPLVAMGRCRLAEQADLIVSLLPGGEQDCAAVLRTHRQRWPGKLGA